MYSQQIPKNTPPDRQAIPLPAWVIDSHKPTQENAKPAKETTTIPSWLITDSGRCLHKQSTLDANSKITDYFKGSKNNLASRDEVSEGRSFSTKSGDDKSGFLSWKNPSDFENGASSQRVFGGNFKYPSTVSYSKNTSFDSLSDFKDPNAQIKNAFGCSTFSCLTRKNTDTAANSSSSSSQDILSILTPTSAANSQNEEISSRSTTSNSENAFPLQSQNTAIVSQDLFSSSSDSVATAQAYEKSVNLTVAPSIKRNRPPVNYMELSESESEDEAMTQSKRKTPAKSRLDLANFSSNIKASNAVKMLSQDLRSSSLDSVATAQASQKTESKENRQSINNVEYSEFDCEELTQRKRKAPAKTRVDLAKFNSDAVAKLSQNPLSSSSNCVAQAAQESKTLTVAQSQKENRPSVSNVELSEFDFDAIAMTQTKRKRVQLYDFNFDKVPTAEEWTTVLKEGLKKIRDEEVVVYSRYFESYGWPLKPEKEALIAKISAVLADSQRTGIIVYRKTCYSNCVFSENRLLMKPFRTAIMSFIQRNNRQTSLKFILVRILLAKIKELLESGASVTQRALYYQYTNFVRKPEQVNSALLAISRILDVGPWELRIFNTNKGLVHGDLKLICEDGEIVNCNAAAGTLIPQNVETIVRFETKAEFIIVVEKDTVFQKLLDENFQMAMPVSFILMTGKGYPDTNTRLFLNKLYTDLKLPVFLLVDANPHGIDIMFTYRIGTLNLAHLSHLLTLPIMKWLGVFPSEIRTLNLVRQELTTAEVVKIEQILQREYMVHFPKIRNELMIMRDSGVKAEIEGAIKCNDFLSQLYLPRKFGNKDYL